LAAREALFMVISELEATAQRYGGTYASSIAINIQLWRL